MRLEGTGKGLEEASSSTPTYRIGISVPFSSKSCPGRVLFNSLYCNPAQIFQLHRSQLKQYDYERLVQTLNATLEVFLVLFLKSTFLRTQNRQFFIYILFKTVVWPSKQRKQKRRQARRRSLVLGHSDTEVREQRLDTVIEIELGKLV